MFYSRLLSSTLTLSLSVYAHTRGGTPFMTESEHLFHDLKRSIRFIVVISGFLVTLGGG